MNTKETASAPADDAKPFSVAPPSIAPTVQEPLAYYLHHAPAAEGKDEIKSLRDEARLEYMRQFGERCRQARSGREISDIAAIVGVHRNTIWNIERGQSLPDAFEMQVLAKEYRVSVAYLMGGESAGKAMSVDLVPKSVQAVQVDGFIYVPLFDIRVSAGNGTFNDVESVIAMRPFDADFIRNELGISHNDIAMSGLVGKSAEPVLSAKDTVLTDLRDKEAMTEGLHIVRLDGAVLVKKLQRLPGRILRVSSFNPDYEPFDIQGHDDSDRDFAIIGRVRWGGVTFH